MNSAPFTIDTISAIGSLALMVLLVWTINRWRHERDISAASAYLYLASLIALIAMTIGLAELLGTLAGEVLFDRPELLGGPDDLRRRLVPRIAVVIVATPLWALHWTLVQRRARDNLAEQRAFIRTFYLYVTLAVAAVAGLFLLGEALGLTFLALAGRPDLHPGDIFAAFAVLVPPLAVWIAHMRIAAAESPAAPGARVPRDFYYYALAGIALFAAAAGARAAGTVSLDALFPSGELLAGDPAALVVQRQAPALAILIAGSAFFYWHWTRVHAEAGSRIRLTYLLLVAAAALSGAVGAFIWTAREALQFGLGYRAVAGQWVFLTTSIPVLLISGGVYLSHRLFLNAAFDDGTDAAFVARRLSIYTLNIVGLALGAFALANLVRLLLELYTTSSRDLGLTADWWRDRTSLYTVMAFVGLPIWIATRRRLTAAVDAGNLAEIRIWPRRLYLYGTLLVVLIIVLVNAVGVVRPLIATALGETYTASLAAGLYIAFANTLIAGIIFWHFARSALADRALAAGQPEPEPAVEPAIESKPRIIAIVSRDARAAIRRLEAALGEPIEVLGNIGPDLDNGRVDLSPHRLAELADDIRSTPHMRILLIVSPHRLDMIPFD